MKNANSVGVYGKFLNNPPTPRMSQPPFPSGQVISMYPIKVEIDSATDNDPVRELRNRLQQSRSSSNAAVQTPSLSASTESINFEQISSENQEIFKSETTIFLLISLIVAFLLLNLIGVLIYLYRRNKKLNRKYDNTNIFDDDKRSKFNDTDDGFILRKSNNTYESVKRHSPINGYGVTRQMSTSTSTVDTNMKVIGWMCSENGGNGQVKKYLLCTF